MLDQHAVNELVLYAQNTYLLYSTRIMPILINLSRKMRRGSYDHERAVKLWEYVAIDAAKSYVAEGLGRGLVWHKEFPVAVRHATAKELADSYLSEIVDMAKGE